MTWREAFLRQARSDAAIMDRLNVPNVEHAHRLHYVQMVSEKLAKGFFQSLHDPDPPRPTHAAFVRMLQAVKARPDIRQILGYANAEAFARFINALLPLAQRIQSLAPSIAGFTQPNAEYPWRPTPAAAVIAPCDHDFAEFDPRQPQMAKLMTLLQDLTRIVA